MHHKILKVNGQNLAFDKKGKFMFICNVSMQKIKRFRILLYIIIAIFIISIMIFVYNKSQKDKLVYITDSNSYDEIYEISNSNYTNMLKDCYEHLDNYVGKKIKCTGFVHRLYDFKDNQFVIAREMLTSPISNSQAEVVIVGFLCESDNTSSLKEKEWIEIEGEITKGFYHSEIPIIKITNVTKRNCPDNPLVNPPDGGYVTQQST